MVSTRSSSATSSSEAAKPAADDNNNNNSKKKAAANKMERVAVSFSVKSSKKKKSKEDASVDTTAAVCGGKTNHSNKKKAAPEPRRQLTWRRPAKKAPPPQQHHDSSTSSSEDDDEGPNENSPYALPSTLAPRCMRVYGWTKRFAKQAVSGYSKFMHTKRMTLDWDATLLSPPPIIDRVWQQHVLDTQNYNSWCRRHVIHYNPDEGAKQDAARLHRTMEQVQKYFDIDEEEGEIWAFSTAAKAAKKARKSSSSAFATKKRSAPDSSSEEDEDGEEEEEEDVKPPSRKRRRTNKGSKSSSGNSSSSSSSDSDTTPARSSRPGSSSSSSSSSRQPLTIFVRWGQNPDPHRSSDLYFKIRPDTKMQRVFDRYALYWNDAIANLPQAGQQRISMNQDFVFFFGAQMVKATDTAATLGLVTDDMIYATRSSAIEMEESDEE